MKLFLRDKFLSANFDVDKINVTINLFKILVNADADHSQNKQPRSFST